MTIEEIKDYEDRKEMADLVPLYFTETEVSYKYYDHCLNNSFMFYLDQEKKRHVDNNMPFNQMLVDSETFFKSGAYAFAYNLEK